MEKNYYGKSVFDKDFNKEEELKKIDKVLNEKTERVMPNYINYNNIDRDFNYTFPRHIKIGNKEFVETEKVTHVFDVPRIINNYGNFCFFMATMGIMFLLIIHFKM